MNKTILYRMPRRDFLISMPVVVLGNRLAGFTSNGLEAFQAAKRQPEALTPAELAAVEKSAFAKDLKNYFGEGYSCAESMLIIGLHYLDKPEELVWIASGFGRGMLHRDVCGIVTGGIMTLGLAAGQLKKERKEAQEWNKQKVQDYWAWWTSQSPLRCTEIRKEGMSFEVCLRLGLLAAVKIEELVSSVRK